PGRRPDGRRGATAALLRVRRRLPGGLTARETLWRGTRGTGLNDPRVVTDPEVVGSMAYFVTGATGFIGRHLVQELVDHREGDIFVLCRESSLPRLELMAAQWGG